MNITLFVTMLFCLQLFYFVVGRQSSKNIQGQDDYFLAGKSVKLFPLMMTFLATQVGGGVILGSADEAYRYGWPVLLYPLGAALGLMFLGSGVGRRLAGFKVSTIAEILEIAYGSPLLRKICSIFSILSLFMVIVAQIIGSHKFLVSLGFDNTPFFIVFWSIVIIYTAQGGLLAVISTDLVQAAFFSGVFLACFGCVLFFEPSVASISMPQLDSFTPVSSKLCGWLLMPLFFMAVEQSMGQRCFAGASPKIVSRAAFIAGVSALIICFVPVFLGCLANATALEVPQGGSVLMTVIAKTTNPWMTALVGCAVLAAIISTATSLINAISANLMNDFKAQGSLKTTKGITCLISIAAIFFAFYFDNIVDVLIQSYELSVSCLFVPVWMALYSKRKSFMAALLALTFGALGFFLFRAYPIPFPREVASLLLSFFGYATGTLLTARRVLWAK